MWYTRIHDLHSLDLMNPVAITGIGYTNELEVGEGERERKEVAVVAGFVIH